MSPAEFCREIEAYLCRKNDGHLIRIVGPVFGTVTGWAEQGIPLKVAFQGIDRYFDRLQHKPRRRPVPIQFCEADILDAFDAWRRALGLSVTAARSLATPTAQTDPPGPSAGGPIPIAVDEGTLARDESTQARRRGSLQTHIDRVMARLTQRRVDVAGSAGLGEAIDSILGQLDALRADAKGLRGDARQRVVETLGTLDRALIEAASGTLDDPGRTAMRAEAVRELEPFRSRMPPETFARAVAAAAERLVRERMRLPTIRIDE